MKFYFKYI